ncbi:MAG: amidase family protein [Acidobacteria bacterium]|nr:amidase family protein [Acidobacteriota bacterium]
MKSTAALLLCALLTLQGQTFEVAESTIAAQQKAMTEGRTSSKALVQSYLDRIAAFDQRGPRLNAIITINPNALKEAEALDRERAAKGARGPLHGVPVIVKDNYGTADMPTTAGTLALLGFTPATDAHQVKKLREAGAVIIAKSNLHELASGITTVGSAFGQTLNPYDPARNPGGSSGGTGAAIAASYAAVGMGSDTCGSIRIPAAVNNLVGLRPTKGLSSIAGIVPLSTTQDTGGPLARTTVDLALVLDATVGEDPADLATRLGPNQQRPNFTAALQTASLKDLRIGILEPLFGDASDDAEVIKLVRAAIEEMKKLGAVPVPVPLPELVAAIDGASVIALEFKEDLAAYLAAQPNAPVHSLDEIVSGGLIHVSLETVMRARVSGKGRDSIDYKLALAKRAALQQLILKTMADNKVDVLAYPTLRRKVARINEAALGSTCQLSATTGFPAITMPAGFTADGLPVAVELFGRPFDDAKLVGYSYVFESATHHRRAPARTPALDKLSPIHWQANNSALQTKFSLNPSTGELSYSIAATGLPAGDILALTLHRKDKEENGPVIAVFANRDFKTIDGTLTLSDPDRERLKSSGLYLRLATKSKSTNNMRLILKPGQI